MGRCGTVLEVSARMVLAVLGPSLLILSAWGQVVWAASSSAPSLSIQEMIDEARSAELDGRNEDHDYWTGQALQSAPAIRQPIGWPVKCKSTVAGPRSTRPQPP